jgi:hypothetical protein
MKEIGKDETFSHILERFTKETTWVHIDCFPGWAGLILDCDAQLAKIDPQYEVLQIKQKFGKLRYYFKASDESLFPKMQKIVIKTETISGNVCEICGVRGQAENLGGSLYVQTLCRKHKFGY